MNTTEALIDFPYTTTVGELVAFLQEQDQERRVVVGFEGVSRSLRFVQLCSDAAGGEVVPALCIGTD